MKLLISIILILSIISIAASIQSGNSSNETKDLGGITNNAINQTNNSINKTNITDQMNTSNQTIISNQTNISAVSSRSILVSNGSNRTAMQTPLNALFESEPVSFSGNLAARSGEGPVMETPSQAAFGSYVI